MPRYRTCERVMDERPLARVLVLQEQWEVEHPVKLVPRLVDEAELLAEVQTQSAEHPLHHRRAVRDEEHGRAGRRAKCLELSLGEELRDRRAHIPALVIDEI